MEIKVQPPKLSGAMLAAAQSAADPSSSVLEEIVKRRVSLFPPVTPPDLHLIIADGVLESYSTKANYHVETPRCKGEALDFEIAAAVNFGLRGYTFDSDKCVRHEVGDYDTAYYSVAVDHLQNLLAFAIPGHARIEIYDLDSLEILGSIAGYSATTLDFHKGRLFFGGYPEGGAWDQASIFSADPGRFEVVDEFFQRELADVRGIAFFNGLVAVSDSYRNRVILAEDEIFEPQIIYEGLNYPNGVSFDHEGNLLIADEHNGLIHRVSLDGDIVWSSPPFQLISPGSVVEVAEGCYSGHYLVADADGNRIILVDPVSWEIKFEVTGTRSVLKAVPIY
ncbi:hypothetical protein KD146_13880 [Devosia sp. BSSL-BM10]|uniref:Uncharacterized protein n=1 Tax=Devosia litorisediminis TaxID=2829817 RepID=A0A942I6S1_9HYPH|nr:hypothetical protein [Devosia litorisediminis]MBS3849787.1 hypothetical protein [Devosia litorisediminis]